MNVKKVLTAALDAATAPKRANTQALLYDRLVEMEPAAAYTSDEYRGLRSAQKKWQQAFQGTIQFSETGARARFAAQFSDGKDHTDVTVRTRGLESLVSENAGKMLACKEAMSAASREAMTIVNAITARLKPAADKILTARVNAETTEAERFGLVRVPSAFATALAEFCNGLQQRPAAQSYGKPADMLHFITID